MAEATKRLGCLASVMEVQGSLGEMRDTAYTVACALLQAQFVRKQLGLTSVLFAKITVCGRMKKKCERKFYGLMGPKQKKRLLCYMLCSVEVQNQKY